MESTAKEMKYFVKIVMLFILSLLLTGCKSQPKVNISKDAKQPKPTYTQTDYDALRDAVLSDGFESDLPVYGDDNDEEYDLLRISPIQRESNLLYPTLHYYNSGFRLGYTRYDDIVAKFGKPMTEYNDGITLYAIYEDKEFRFYYFSRYKMNSVLISFATQKPEYVNEITKKKLEDIIEEFPSDYIIGDNGECIEIRSDEYFIQIGYTDIVGHSESNKYGEVPDTATTVEEDANEVVEVESTESSEKKSHKITEIRVVDCTYINVITDRDKSEQVDEDGKSKM